MPAFDKLWKALDKEKTTKPSVTAGNNTAYSSVYPGRQNGTGGAAWNAEGDITPPRPADAPPLENEDDPQPSEEITKLQEGRLLLRNIMRGDTYSWELNRAVRDGRPPEEIALIATKCVSLMKADTIAFKKLAEDYRQKYGLVMEDEFPYKIRREK